MTLTVLFSASQKFLSMGLLLYATLAGNPAGKGEGDDDATAKSTAAKSSAVSIKGVDVSRWQKEIDWEQVKGADVTFAFVKATQGDFRLDPYFTRNWEETKRMGIKRGAYHFFKPEAPVEGQIELFKSTVTLEPGDLPPVLDVEVSEPKMTSTQLRQNIRTWLEAITQYYGVKPIIYTSQNYYRRYLQGYFPEYHFWIARYSEVKPEIHHTDSWMFWQYTDSGSISGINSAVDINFFAGDLETLSQLCMPELVIAQESPLKQMKYIQPQP
ncbi:glycoside hydrolase family 25 protein [Pontibacter chitinilyticus]|uniref:glycoside hydrolase family 25 protein n=1 Tax=Pontibacter chitinilyticus TaxID=2674989 RepID=UPI0032191D84